MVLIKQVSDLKLLNPADGTYTVNFDTPLDEGYVVSVNSATGSCSKCIW